MLETADQQTMRLEAGLETMSGFRVGRHPGDMTSAQIMRLGHRKKSLKRVIRERCMDCCANQQHEGRKCTVVACALWPYRMGTKRWSWFVRPLDEAAKVEAGNGAGQNRPRLASRCRPPDRRHSPGKSAIQGIAPLWCGGSDMPAHSHVWTAPCWQGFV